MTHTNRKTVVAGQFYSADAKALKEEVLGYLHQIPDPTSKTNTVAIIAPHAGYIYSGLTAAAAYKQIDKNKKWKHVFILTSSHQMLFEGASIYTIGDYETPLGIVSVDLDLPSKLIKEHNCFNANIAPHINEHSLEVQLPFLQTLLKKDFNIIPIIIGGQSFEILKNIAAALKPYMNGENLFIISSDFSHYPNYEGATESDRNMANAIISNDTAQVIKMQKAMESKGIHSMSTAMCGWSSVLTLLYMTEGNNDIQYKKVHYSNSGDSPHASKDRVVGYNAISVHLTKNNSDNFNLTNEDKSSLLTIARKSIEDHLKPKSVINTSKSTNNANLQIHCGAFVSLHKEGNLRGCIGRFEPSMSLWETIQRLAIAAATEDTRFPELDFQELKNISIEISVLTPMRKIDSIKEIELGKHGIYIKQSYSGGTFLPQVADETGWTLEEFLGHCSRDKAGIGWDGWKKAEIYIYEAIVFGEDDPPRR